MPGSWTQLQYDPETEVQQREMQSEAGDAQRGFQRKKLTQNSEHEELGAGQSREGRRRESPGGVGGGAAAGSRGAQDSTLRLRTLLGVQTSSFCSLQLPGQERRDLAQLPPFPETDWFVRISLLSPPLPQSQVKIFSLSTEGGGGTDVLGKIRPKCRRGWGPRNLGSVSLPPLAPPLLAAEVEAATGRLGMKSAGSGIQQVF